MIEDGTESAQSQGSSSSSSSTRIIRFRKIPDAEIMLAVQVAIRRSVREMDAQPDRDLLIQDFMNFESILFESGTPIPGTMSLGEFKFLDYAPIAFKYFRRLFDIKTDNFFRSMCSEPLRQLENSGASGSIFYLTHDDEYILKTVRQKEGEFLLKLLPGYYLNLTQNPRTLMPKFFGFYCYTSLNTSLRLLVMNNLVPSSIPIDQKYDLKGSTTKRKATLMELKKPLPTYKDLDFIEHHPGGLFVETEQYVALAESLQRDCRVLESFKIIDYSLLLAIHYVDKNAMDEPRVPRAGIPAKTMAGESVLVFVGIIDILQSYQFRKKIEHTLKSIFYEKDSISVHRPDFYSQRFQNFILRTVFRPTTKPLTSCEKSDPCCSGSNLVPKSQISHSWTANCTKYAKRKGLPIFSDDTNTREKNAVITNIYERVEEGVVNETALCKELDKSTYKKHNDEELMIHNLT